MTEKDGYELYSGHYTKMDFVTWTCHVSMSCDMFPCLYFYKLAREHLHSPRLNVGLSCAGQK